MKLDKESIIVIAIAGAILVAWFIFYPKYQKDKALEQARIQKEMMAQKAEQAYKPVPPMPEEQAPVTARTMQTAPVAAPAAAPVAADTPAVIKGEKFFTISNDRLEIKLDVLASAIDTMTLLNYKHAKTPEGEEEAPAVIGGKDAKHKSLQPVMIGASCLSAEGTRIADNAVRIVSKWSNGLSLIQQITLPAESYTAEVQYTLENPTANIVSVSEFIVWTAGVPPTQYLAGDKIYSERHNIDAHPVGEKSIISGDPAAKEAKFNAIATEKPVDWAGSSNKFFASLLFVDTVAGGVSAGTRIERNYLPMPEKPTDQYVIPSVGIAMKNITIPASSSMAISSMRYYFGPKEMSEIRKLPPSVMDAMHISYFSWFEFLARPMVRFLVYLNSIFHSYGIAIIVLTLLVRLIFWPVTQKANNSMRKMQKLKPKMDELREKYKDNPQELNMRMMELYRNEKVSPLGGCLPILLQIPVFFALYSALDSAVELRHVSFLWAADLARPDLIGPQIDLPFFGPTGLHPLVIAMTLLMVLQQKMTPSNMDPMQQKMMMFMPVIMLFMLYNLPSGLTLYWTVSQIFSILQMKYGQIVAEREEAKAASAAGSNNNKS